jgi:beta-lactam-binding protein with PASTA domain
MRNLMEDFGQYLADYSDISSYIVAKVLQSEGLTYRYEFIYYDDVSPQMNGRIIGQFPEPGTAVITGRTTVIIKLIRKR